MRPDPQSLDIESVYAKAVEFSDLAARDAYLQETCRHDEQLKRRVERLLAAHDQRGDFLSSRGVAQTAVFADVIEERLGAHVGPYKLLEEIGEGGMGVVYMAEQTKPLRRRVALKIIKPGLDTRAVVARFEAERQALALMDHPNIARVYDAGSTDSGRPFFVMELVRGVPITDYCRERNVPLRERLNLFIEVCDAVQHAHQKGIIHRDLKPTNVLVAQSDTKPVPKVIDFGVAKATSQPLTERTLFTAFSQIIGTPLYMSPEQADPGNQDVDTRSDVYSLGVLLYELLTGTTPFDAERLRSLGADEMRRIIREEEPPRPSTRATTNAAAMSTLAAGLPSTPLIDISALKGDLDWIVMKALEKDRLRRYESPRAMSLDIARFMNDEAIEARRPSQIYVLRKFARRHRAVAIMISIIAVTLVTASLISTVSAVRASRAQKVAVASEEAAEAAKKEAERALTTSELARRQATWNLYAAQMNQAVAAWEAREYGILGTLLKESEPVDNAPDFRGWEWYFLQQQYRAVFAQAPSKLIRAAAWHPQKTEFAVAVRDEDQHCHIEIWKPDRKTPLRFLAKLSARGENDDRVSSVSHLAWSADGRRVACAFRPPSNSDGAQTGAWVNVFDADSGDTVFCREVYKSADWDRRIINAISITQDGKTLATGSRFGQIKLWNVEDGTPGPVLFDPQEPSNHHSLAFSPDGMHLAATLRGGLVDWNIATGARFDYPPSVTGDMVLWSPDGEKLAACGESAVAIYQRDAPQPVAILPHLGVRTLSWPNDQTLVTGGTDQYLKVWDAEKLTNVQTMSVGRSPLTELDVSHDGKFLIMGSEATIRVVRLDREFGKTNVIRPNQHADGEYNLVQWSHDGSRIASAWLIQDAPNKSHSLIRIIDVAANRQIAQHELDDLVESLAWSDKDTSLLASTDRRGLYVFGNGRSIDRVETDIGGPGGWKGNSISPDGTWIACIHDSEGREVVEIRDCTTLQVVGEWALDSGAGLLAWSPDAKRVLAACWGNLLVLNVDARTQTSIPKLNISADYAHSAAWDPTSQLLAIGNGDGSIEIWDPTKVALITRLEGHRGPTGAIDWSGDGRRIASAGLDGTVRLWDAATGDMVAKFLVPDGMMIHNLQWSPDSRQLAGGATNGEIIVFDATSSIPPSFTPAILETDPISAAFSRSDPAYDDSSLASSKDLAR